MKKNKRIIAMLLSALMLLSVISVFTSVFAAAPAGKNEETLGMNFTDYQPIPLLVIKVNFDADGDGKDCYEILDEKGERSIAFVRYMYTTNRGIYDALYKDKYGDKPAVNGEQFCYSPDSYWANLCFGEERGTLNDYYKYISNGEFYWIPVEETSGTENDGVITVTINAKHPGAEDADGLYDSGERRLAMEAADQYVDFSKYDKDGNGDLDFTELSVVYIYGGNEISYGASATTQYVYNTHAHVSRAHFGGLTCDGVGVWSKGAQSYVRMGEYRGGLNDPWARMGKLAHELGHVLGAKDLYIDSKSWIGGCGELSLMGGGSGGKNGNFSAPTVLDPYYKVLYGFAKEEIASSAKTEYTLYSHESTEGAFNVIRVNTLNPKEYYLIENRSHASDGYDNNTLNGDMQGILIWHIDESIVNGYSRPNNGDEGHAVGFTIIAPTNAHYDIDENSTWSSTSASNVFVASNEAKYVFPVSTPDGEAKWYTSMTEEQAAQCNIRIEFLTEAGNEMKIRITGANDLPAEFTLGDSEKTQTEMSIGVNITDYNGAAVTGCKIYFGKDKNLTDAQVVDATEIGVGKYSAKFEGLTASTEYYYKAEVTSANGTGTSNVRSAFTKAVPVVDTTATITYIVKGDIINTTTENVKIGNQPRMNFPLSKDGYTFGGWYLDEGFTQPYTKGPVETADDFTLYAKWVEEAPKNTTASTSTTATTATTATTTTTAPATTTNATTADTTAPVQNVGCGGGSANMDYALIGGGAIVAILGGAAGTRSAKKKRDGSDETL